MEGREMKCRELCRLRNQRQDLFMGCMLIAWDIQRWRRRGEMPHWQYAQIYDTLEGCFLAAKINPQVLPPRLKEGEQ